jgi:MFS family permease
LLQAKVINWQMWGMLIGGIVWGIMGDKKGRLSVLFGSIIFYSLKFFTGFVQDVQQYAMARFVAGVGLAGELGAIITLVSELLPKNKRGVGTSMVAGIGLFGAVAAYFTYKISGDWRLCYKIGAGLGVLLLFLRISVVERNVQACATKATIVRGTLCFPGCKTFRYILAILIGLPTWFVIEYW